MAALSRKYCGNITRYIEKRSDTTEVISEYGFEFMKIAPRGLYQSPLRTNGWDTARSSGSMLLFDFDTAFLISRAYQVQQDGVSTTLGRIAMLLYERNTFDKTSSARHWHLCRAHFRN